MRVKVVGAGSIGNHLSNAARRLGWAVDLVDLDPRALERTRTQIYPGRYGSFDPAIRLYAAKDAPKGGYDLICIGTPPDSHVALALAAVEERPRAVLVEKPLSPPDLAGLQELHDRALSLGVAVFVGYDHVVGAAAKRAAALVGQGRLGDPITLDVEFREHWAGIFAAHPWLDGPGDSYLGYWRRGGGASGEHSHAINLWQHFARVIGAGAVTRVHATLDYVTDGKIDYDRLCILTLWTESGLVGRCVQDVVTRPPRKWGRIQGSAGFIEWHCGWKPGHDAVLHGDGAAPAVEEPIAKTRPDDFIRELEHVATALAEDPRASPIAIERGLDTMLVVAAAHLAARSGHVVAIDRAKGCGPGALRTI